MYIQPMGCKSRLQIARCPVPKTQMVSPQHRKNVNDLSHVPFDHTKFIYSQKLPGWLPTTGIQHPRMFYGNGPRLRSVPSTNPKIDSKTTSAIRCHDILISITVFCIVVGKNKIFIWKNYRVSSILWRCFDFPRWGWGLLFPPPTASLIPPLLDCAQMDPGQYKTGLW
jgi:hypothetical protein